MRLRQNNGAFVLLASIGLVIFLGILLSASFLRSQSQLQETLRRLVSQQAFYAAETGLQRSLFELRRSANWRPIAGDPAWTDLPLNATDDPKQPANIIGTYSVEAKDAPDFGLFQSVWVKATGKALDTDGITIIQRAIFSRLIIINPALFFVSTTGDLHVASGSTFNASVLGKDVYFDVNKAGTITVNGNVFYMTSVTGNADPTVTITGKTQQMPSISFVGVDLEHYRDIAKKGGAGYYSANDIIYTGDIALNNPNAMASNGLVFSEKDIHISGQIKDSMLFVAGGNIYIDDNIISDKTQAQPPQLGLLSKNDVFVSNGAPPNITVEAFIVADGNEGLDPLGGVFTAQGPKLSKGTINFNGAIAVRGDNAVRSAVDLNAYSVRNYQYNAALQNNRSIPFLPFIANIVLWQEADPFKTMIELIALAPVGS